MRIKKIVLASLFAIPFSSQAANYDVTICKIQATSYTNNLVILAPCGGWTSKSSCTNGTWVSWQASSGQGQYMNEMALHAYKSGEQVTISTNGACTAEQYDEITSIRLTKY